MFVRFRSSPKRLHISVVASHRVDGRMKQEHVASLGSIPAHFTAADRVAFWRKTIERLERLSNRLNEDECEAIVQSIVARIPAVTAEDVRAVQLANAEGEAKAFEALRDIAAGDVEALEKQVRDKRATHKALTKVLDNAGRAAKRLKAGESVGGYLDKPEPVDQLLKRLGFTKAHLRHMSRLAQMTPEKFEAFVDAVEKAEQRVERQVAKKMAPAK